ncbi:MAG: GNAT family N-acetyltransferase [Planctomycetaceae bacterium]|nr:GNAT family N-acetyltransferase [Planctomycetaceae bacterium]
MGYFSDVGREIMLSTRSFRNEDLLTLLALWRKSQWRSINAGLVSLSANTLQLHPLGVPFCDPRSIILAFDDNKPVGYVHTSLSPNSDGSGFDPLSGQICFMAVNPEYSDTRAVARLLLNEGEKYLLGLNVKKIFGASPRCCVPFYVGFYGDSEPVAFFDSEPHIIAAFQESDYHVSMKTYRYRLDLENYQPPITATTVGWRPKLTIGYDNEPESKTWLEACCFANDENNEWVRVSAYFINSNKRIAYVWIRITKSDSEEFDPMFASGANAGLIDVRVRSEYYRNGIATYLLGETLRFAAREYKTARIEAHISQDDVPMNKLLKTLQWKIIDTGTAFYKDF